MGLVVLIALRPVPIAVPPIFTSYRMFSARSRAAISFSRLSPKALNSCPSVTGTECTVGDYLVRGHVGRGASAALYQVNGKLIMQLAVHNLFAGFFNAGQDFLAELLAVVIGPRGRELYHEQRTNQLGILR